MSHTPGPWTLEGGMSGSYDSSSRHRHPLVTGPNRENPICEFTGDWDDEWDNAALIAAAPDLLAVVEHLVRNDHSGLWTPEFEAQVNAAIAKARIAKARIADSANLKGTDPDLHIGEPS